ncbi:hypothetical protein NUB00_002227 [Salmonella enterica]|nr:hypothetical protein [Salmonella enterica]
MCTTLTPAVSYLEHQQDREDTTQLIDRLDKWLQEEGNLDALYFWFQQYDLAGFNPNRCEHTATLTSIRRSGSAYFS